MNNDNNNRVIPLFDDLPEPAGGTRKTSSGNKVEVARRSTEEIVAHRQARMCEQFSAIQGQDAWSAGSAGFLPNCLVQASLPYKDPGDQPTFFKTNGRVSLLIQPGHVVVTETPPGSHVPVSRSKCVGFPYGSIPRLLLAWISTQAVTERKRQIQMGRNLSNFMQQVGYGNVSGGQFGNITRLKDQTTRLLMASIQVQENRNETRDETSFKRLDLVEAAIYTSDMPQALDPFGSIITLNDDFYRQLIENPVPLDFRALQALKASPLSLDLYAWLTWTMFWLKREKIVDWGTLHSQFGSSGSERKLRENLCKALLQVKRVYPSANVQPAREGLVLRPSPTHVPVKRTVFPTLPHSPKAA
jgi:hypothetical protein